MKKNNANTTSNKTADTKKKSGMRTDGFCLPALLHNLKKLFLPWVLASVLSAGAIIGSNAFLSTDVDALSSTISFYFNGIEEGLDPNGCEFDKNALKSDSIVSEALSELGMPEDIMESVQNGILVDSVVSSSAISKITMNDSIYESNNSLESSSISDSSYHPTVYKVSFNYNATSLSGEQAAELLNLMLEKYQASFIETFGYNESVGASILEFDFSSYDYLIALDMYSSKIATLENYVNSLNGYNASHFRSEKTNYTFSDISDSLALVRSIDIDSLTSYILNNGVMSDKEMILSYYEFRLNNLKRYKQNSSEKLASVTESIEQYKKDSVIVYENANSTSSVTKTSDVYDNLIQRKLNLQDTVSNYDSIIADFTDRITIIKKASATASKADKEYIDEKIAALQSKVGAFVENIKITADDYYETEKFNNAVTIVSPAKYSAGGFIKSAISESIRLLIIAELLLITLYLSVSIGLCFGSKAKAFKDKHFR